MQPVYLTHPAHGVHVAYTPQEVERCAAAGWTQDVPAQAPAPEAREEPAPATPARRVPVRLPRRGERL